MKQKIYSIVDWIVLLATFTAIICLATVSTVGQAIKLGVILFILCTYNAVIIDLHFEDEENEEDELD